MRSGYISSNGYRIALFQPKGNRDLREIYPELAEIEEFRIDKLSKEDMLFVWAFANSTSPFYEISSFKQKVSKCYDYAYNMNAPEGQRKGTAEQKDLFIGGNFPNDIRLAIERMRLFNPQIRFRGLKILSQIFDEYEKIVEEQMIYRKKRGVDSRIDAAHMEIITNFVNSAKKIQDELPTLMKRLEEGFGIIARKESPITEQTDNEDIFSQMMQSK